MTNDIIGPALLAAASTNNLQFATDNGPVWPFIVTLVWFLLSVGAPVLSFVLCVQGPSESWSRGRW